jgi:hypothetical protein
MGEELTSVMSLNEELPIDSQRVTQLNQISSLVAILSY